MNSLNVNVTKNVVRALCSCLLTARYNIIMYAKSPLKILNYKLVREFSIFNVGVLHGLVNLIIKSRVLSRLAFYLLN